MIIDYRFISRVFVCVFFVSLLSLPSLSQWEDVTSLKNVQFPFNLQYEDKTIKKGKYRVEILKRTTPSLSVPVPSMILFVSQ